MKRFVEGDDRKQVALLPECVDDYIEQIAIAVKDSDHVGALRGFLPWGL